MYGLISKADFYGKKTQEVKKEESTLEYSSVLKAGTSEGAYKAWQTKNGTKGKGLSGSNRSQRLQMKYGWKKNPDGSYAPIKKKSHDILNQTSLDAVVGVNSL